MKAPVKVKSIREFHNQAASIYEPQWGDEGWGPPDRLFSILGSLTEPLYLIKNLLLSFRNPILFILSMHEKLYSKRLEKRLRLTKKLRWLMRQPAWKKMEVWRLLLEKNFTISGVNRGIKWFTYLKQKLIIWLHES